MHTFYMIISKEKLYLYKKDNDEYLRQQIEGNYYFRYSINNVRNDVNRLLNSLVKEFNMDTRAEIMLVVIDNEDDITSRSIEASIKEYTVDKYDISTLMLKVLKTLDKDSSLLINEFGVNFDGKNYIQKDDRIVKKGFNLLGYTLDEDDLMKYI